MTFPSTPEHRDGVGIPERLWWALFILVPVAYNPISRWQYEPDKAALTLGLVGALLGVSLLRGQVTRARASRLEVWLVAGLCLRWLATSHSYLPAWSLWGDPAWRSNGLWFAMAMAALFVLARRQLATSERRVQAIDALLIGSAVVAGYGVLQYAGLDPLSCTEWVRVPSTLAHPNLLAAYLAMVLPLTAVRLWDAVFIAQRFWPRRAALAGLLALQGLCLVFTYSRAGWLAALAGLGVALVMGVGSFGYRRIVTTVVAVGAVGGVALLVLSLLPPLPGDAPHALQTLTSLFRWRGATAQIRLLAWQAGLEAFRDRPWLGYGPATFGTVLPWYLPPSLTPFGGAEALGGRPHNVFLEMALEEGAPGLLCFGLTLVALFRPLLTAPARGVSRDARLLLAALVGSLAANLVTYGFSFESATTAVLFWALSGIAHGIVSPLHGRPQPPRPVLGRAIAAGSALLALWMAAPDVLAFLGESLSASGYYPLSIAALDNAIALGPTPEVLLGVKGEVYATWAVDQRDATRWPLGAAAHLDRVTRQPLTVLYWQQWGNYLRRWYNAVGDPDIALRSVAAFTEALKLSPTDPDLWLDRGLARLEAGQPELALADFAEAQTLLPDYTRYYGAMSVYALYLGDTEAAAAWQARALATQEAWDAWAWRR